MPRINSLNTFVFSSILNSSGEPEQANYQGATMVFVLQGTAPTGWVKDTSDTDYTLRCVTGSALSGGSSGFSSVMSSKTLTGSLSVAGTVDATSLTSSQIPSHQHGPFPTAAILIRGSNFATGPSSLRSLANDLVPGAATPNGTLSGNGSAHSHPVQPSTSPVTFTNVDLSVKYVESILATRS
jgi:hypothetical protein